MKVALDGAVGEAIELIATPTRSRGSSNIMVLAPSVTGIELNAIILASAKHASGAPSRVSPVAPHDVPDADLPRLPVPQAPADEGEDDEAEDGGQGDGELLALGDLGLPVLGQGLLAEEERQGGRVVLLAAALDAGEEGDGDVLALEVLALVDVEGPEAPGGGDAVRGVEPLVGVARVVEPLEADGDFPGGVVVGLVVVVGIPGD